MFCGWEGNRRSGITLAMRHRLSGLSTYGLKGQCVEDEHPTYAAQEYGPPFLYTMLTLYVEGSHTVSCVTHFMCHALRKDEHLFAAVVYPVYGCGQIIATFSGIVKILLVLV